MLEIVTRTWGYLTWTFLAIVVPLASFIWLWIIVGLLGLVAVGGFASLPLVILLVRYLCARCRGRFATLFKVLIHIGGVIGYIVYVHFWIASAVWWLHNVGGIEPAPGAEAAVIVLLAIFTIFGTAIVFDNR